MKTKMLLAVALCFASLALAQDSSNVRTIGLCDTPGNAYGIAVSGGYAYLGDYGLRIINISNPANPTETGAYEDYATTYGVAVSGNYAYATNGFYGLRIVDISSPSSPAEAGGYDTPHYAQDVAVSGGYAYVADGDSGLRVINVSSPSSPSEAGSYDTPHFAYGVAGITETEIQPFDPAQGKNVKLRVYGNTIEYSIPQSGTASLKVYNLLGQEVRRLINEDQKIGSYEVKWDGRDDSGRRVASGVYLVRLEAQGQTATGKMLVVR